MAKWLLFNTIYSSFPLGASLLVIEDNYLYLVLLNNVWTTLLSILATYLYHNELSRSCGFTAAGLQQNLDNIAAQMLLCSFLNFIPQAITWWRDIGGDYWFAVWPSSHIFCLILNMVCFQLTVEKLGQVHLGRLRSR